MRQVNVALDLYNSIICLILILYLCMDERWRERLNRYFIYMCVANIGMLLSDITNWQCEGLDKPWYPFALRYGSLVYYACSGPLLLFFTKYMIEYLTVKVSVNKSFERAAAGLAFMQIAGGFLSLRYGTFFIIAEGNIYQRGDMFWLSQLIPFGMYGINGSLILGYRSYINKKDKLSLLAYIFFPLAAEGIQIMNYGVALLNTGVTVALLLIFINIQSKRELLLKLREEELAESRINIMLSQIQPHFLYNVLTVIRKLCDIDPKQAKQAISEFSRFLRANMMSLTNKEPIPFVQELEHVRNYVNLEHQRFGERLQVIYEILIWDFKIPSLTLQPIVENAVRHGIINREEGGTIIIRAEETESAYVITILDDGIGFECAKEQTYDQGHVGINNVRQRLSAMCRGTLEINSNPGIGTKAVIVIPKKKM